MTPYTDSDGITWQQPLDERCGQQWPDLVPAARPAVVAPPSTNPSTKQGTALAEEVDGAPRLCEAGCGTIIEYPHRFCSELCAENSLRDDGKQAAHIPTRNIPRRNIPEPPKVLPQVATWRLYFEPSQPISEQDEESEYVSGGWVIEATLDTGFTYSVPVKADGAAFIQELLSKGEDSFASKKAAVEVAIPLRYHHGIGIHIP